MSGSQNNEGSSRHSHPLIREIDEGLDQLDSVFEAFAREYAYEFRKSEDGAFNPPNRTLSRLPQQDGFSRAIFFRVDGRDPQTNAPPPFEPEMPCTLKIFAQVLVGDRWKCLREEIFSAMPFSRVVRELSSGLEAAHTKLGEWTFEKVAKEGVNEV